MGELRLKILSKQRVDDNSQKGWLFLIGKKSLVERIIPLIRAEAAKEPPGENRCISVFAESEKDPQIFEEDAIAIRRRFAKRDPANPLGL